MAVIAREQVDTTDENFHWLTVEEERAHFDTQAREIVGLSGEEFLRRLDTGDYRDLLDDPAHADITYLALLSHIAR